MAVAPQRTAQGSPSVLVEPGSHASAGQAAVLRVHARNISGTTQDFTVSAVGLEGSWLPIPVAVPNVPADATATVELTLTPPVGAAAGDYPFVVTVEARHAPGVPAATTLADGSLRVDGVSDLVLTVEPADSQALRRRKVQVVLANTGDQPVRVRLDATSDPELDVDLGDGDLDIGPHQTVRIPGSVRARRPKFVGHARRTAFHVTATGARAPQRFDGTVSLRAVLTPALLRFVAVTMVAVLWIAGVLAVLPWVSDQFSSDKSDKTATAPSQPPTTGTDGTQGGGGTQGDGDGDAGTAPGTGDADAAPGVRVSGIVTGSAPAGVTVAVQPASALAAPPADDTTTPPSTASGLEGSVATLVHPERALAAALADRVVAKREPSSAGKVLGTSLPVERTDEISQRRSTTTQEDGTWAFADLSPTARYLIVLAKPGFQTQRFLVTGAQAAAASMKVAMVPGKGTMSGLISGPSGAVGGVEVTLSDGTTTVTTRSATSGRVGYWEVDGLSTPSTYLVTASGEKLGAESALVTLGAAATRTVNLALRPGVATLSGTVRGIDSLGGFGGLGGLTVTATAGENTRTATTVTGDRAGTFVLPDLPVPASYTLTISGDGYATQTRQIDLTSAGVSPLDISMTSTGGTVQGTVTEPDGTGVAGAGLVLDGPAGTYKTMSASDATGTFRFSGIAPGQYVLTAVVFAHDPASTQVAVVSGGSATADLVLVPTPGGGLTATSFIRGGVRDASTGGQITCPNIFPGETCEVTVTGVTKDETGTTTPIEVRADPDTDYQFPNPALSSGLLPGLYRLTIAAPGYEPGHVNVTVPMGQVVEATTVALEQSPSVVGTVQAHVGAVPSTTCVIAVPGPGSTRPTAPCGPDPADATRCVVTGAACSFIGINGSYSVNRLTSGTYDVWVVPPANSEYIAPERGTVALVPGSSRRFDAILDRLGVLSVTVMRSDGTSQVLPEQNATIVTSPAAQLTPPTPPTTNASGLAQVRGLAQGVYTVTANPSNGSPGASLANITVGLNQEVSAQLVITTPVSNVAGRVVSQLSSGVSSPVGGAHVEVTGTTGFNGLSPLRTTSTPPATTTSNGDFTVCTTTTGCPTDGSATNLALVEARVDVRVTANGYQAYSATDVPTSALQTITLSPLGTSFKGSVAFDPTLSLADTTTTLDKVRFDVRAAPPGVGQLSLTARMVGTVPTVVWSDSAQGTDPALNGARLIRPGSYTVAASLPGYDTAEISFVVQPGQAMDPITFTLKRFGFLRVSAITAQDFTTPVQGTIMTITLQGGVTQRIEAHPGDSFVDFGDLPTGSYPIDVRAPGYRALTSSVNVSPGQTAVQAQQVPMVKLGALNGIVESQLTAGWTEALPGASVTATRNGQSFPATTGADGSYRITGTTVNDGLVGGTWSITTTAPGQANGTGSATVPDPDFTNPASLEVPVAPIQMVAQKGALRVFAVAGANPVNGLTMQITYRDALNNVTLAPSCVPGSTAGGCPGTDGLYEFNDVLPLTYNLNISGGAYSPLTLPVAVAPGETKSVTVPITTPAGSIQGVVLHQAAGGGTTPVTGATVTLTPASGTAVTNVSDANGQYKFPSVVPGSYTLSTTDNGLGATRTVTVLPGQGLVVDLVLQDVTRQVVVTVTSANGTDLSGALVALTGGTAPPAAQPVVRTAAGANTFRTTFNQVAAGTWGITVSGPSGHLGSTTGSVNVPSTGTGAVNAAVTVTETQIALRATTSATGAPTTVTATVTQGGAGTDVVVFVGGGDSVVFVPATGATVTGATTGGFSVNVSGGAVASGVTYQLVTLDVAGRGSATSASPANQTVSTGATVSVTTQVTATGSNPNVGTVQLQRRTSTGPDVWTDVGSSATATGSNQTLTAVADAAWGTGAVTLRVTYSGGGVWGPSTSGNITVTVQTPTTTTVAFAANVLTATVTPTAATGTVAFFTGTNTPIGGCGNVAVSGGTATCTWTAPTGTTSVHANLNGSGVYADSNSANISVVVP